MQVFALALNIKYIRNYIIGTSDRCVFKLRSFSTSRGFEQVLQRYPYFPMDSFARNNDDLIGRVRIIPGDISADDHSQLDKDATSLSNLAFESMAGDILYFVISASVSSYAKTNWPINVNITNVEACKTLLSSNPEMRPLLEQAHRSGRYSEIRRRGAWPSPLS